MGKYKSERLRLWSQYCSAGGAKQGAYAETRGDPSLEYAQPLLERFDFASPRRQTASRIKTLDDVAIGRILRVDAAVVGDLDRVRLRSDINHALRTSETLDLVRPGSRRREACRQLDEIAEVANKLLALLKARNDATTLINQYAPEAIGYVVRAFVQFEASRDNIQLDDQSVIAAKERFGGRVPSAKEWLFGVELPIVYERYFHRPAAVSRTPTEGKPHGEPSGPMVRFLSAVRDEAEVHYSNESIAKAHTSLSDLRELRKTKRR
jgi:hypothetical protein